MDQCLSITLHPQQLLVGYVPEKMSLLVGPQTETTKRNVPYCFHYFISEIDYNKIVVYM